MFINIGLIVSTVAGNEKVMGPSSGVGPTLFFTFIYQKPIYEIHENPLKNTIYTELLCTILYNLDGVSMSLHNKIELDRLN